ncbi:EF-hand domain-containing protein [Ramlibacter sp. PS4R-6]|uniref:EF-hand domain-containing protein n=1 Tax=Ramlibacter sp. PS4R-6 TaxID=3133438 RepID=UPI0030B2A4CC
MKRVVIAGLACVAALARAGDGPVVAPRDPWVPPAVRAQPHSGHETRGEALRGQVERKLRESFEAADTEGRGTITREQARAAGLGVVADNFDAIDHARSGRVGFDDLKRFLRARGARTL